MGNDAVYIVWSEENADYEQNMVTQFGQVTIVIYPLKDNLYRIQLKSKVSLPYRLVCFDNTKTNNSF